MYGIRANLSITIDVFFNADGRIVVQVYQGIVSSLVS